MEVEEDSRKFRQDFYFQIEDFELAPMLDAAGEPVGFSWGMLEVFPKTLW